MGGSQRPGYRNTLLNTNQHNFTKIGNVLINIFTESMSWSLSWLFFLL